MFFKKLTKNDYEILRVMIEKGTTNSKEISTELSLSEKTVRNRIKEMKKAEVFKTAILIDPKQFGYSLRVDFFLKASKTNIIATTEWLLKTHKHKITYLGRHWGDDNISMQCVFKTGEEVEEFENELKNNKDILDYEISIVPMIFKDTYDWRPHQRNFNITSKGMNELAQRRQSETKKES